MLAVGLGRDSLVVGEHHAQFDVDWGFKLSKIILIRAGNKTLGIETLIILCLFKTKAI